MMPYIGAQINQEERVMVEIDPVVVEIRTVNTVVKAIAMGTALHMETNVKSAAGIIILKQYAKAMINVTQVDQGQRKATKGKDFMRLMRKKVSRWMIWLTKYSHYSIMMCIST